jgi:amidohydrolase
MDAQSLGALKQKAGQEIDRISARLWKIALDIHSHPEIGWETPKAVRWLTEPLEEAGMKTEIGVAGVPSSFLARWSGGKTDRPVVALLAEYDALRGIGHGCGHNLIGTAAVGAGLAVKAAAPDLPGRLLVIGTPFEEGGGGKVVLVEKGLFDSCDAAMVCHPNNRTMVLRGGLASGHMIFRYHGKASHAAAAPEKGISALDAVLQLFFGINQLRQFAPQGHRIHGIITQGGVAPNIVPEFAEAEFIVRAANRRDLLGLKKKVLAIAESAALATGARLEVEEGIIYAERNENPSLSRAFADNLTRLGVRVDPPAKGIGSSDMGNVGEVCPAIHPYVKISDESTSTHSGAFAEAAKSPAGREGMLQAAKALAMTALDLFYDGSLLSRAKEEFVRYREEIESLPK